MSIKGGDLITVGNTVLVDRIQTAGPGQVTIPTEKIYELGNYQSVGTVLDIPDLSFPCESLDASAEMEAMLLGQNFATDPAGTEYDLAESLPLDVVQQFKAGKSATNLYEVIGSVALPYLVCESVSYRFGLRENAAQTMTLRGDSIVYAPGSMYVQEEVGSGVAGQVIVLANTALPNGDVVGTTRYALGVSLRSGLRLINGVDYTEVPAPGGPGPQTVTITVTDAVAVTDTVRVVYASDVVEDFPQSVHALATAARPAAIRGRNIEVFVGGVALADRWVGVQSVTTDWRVDLDRDEEFSNSNIIGQDFDVPAVTGSIDLKPRNPDELIEKIKQISGVTDADESVGALRRVALPVDIVLRSPDDGQVLKTLHVPDARFTVPGFSGRVQQKLTLTFNWESDGGILRVYKGVRPPTVTLIDPDEGDGVAGETVASTITGTNFKTGVTVGVSGVGVTVNTVVRVSATSITLNFVVAAGTAAGDRVVTVTNTDGGAATGTFTVTA